MKQTLMLFLCFLTVTIMNGQIINCIGIKDGFSLANQTWYYKSINLTFKKANRIGLYSTISLDFFNLKYLNLTTDVGYCQKGSMETIPIIQSPTGEDLWYNNFNYLIFSPLLKVKYTTTHFIPYVLLGLRLDYQLSYKTAINISPLENDINKNIYGMNCGVGIEFKFNNIGIFNEFQYQNDFTYVIDSPPSYHYTGLRITNKAYIISSGVKYYFSKKARMK